MSAEEDFYAATRRYLWPRARGYVGEQAAEDVVSGTITAMLGDFEARCRGERKEQFQTAKLDETLVHAPLVELKEPERPQDETECKIMALPAPHRNARVDYRKALLMWYRGATYKDVAEEMGTRPKYVAQLFVKARKRGVPIPRLRGRRKKMQ